jgi:hypothetical protein
VYENRLYVTYASRCYDPVHSRRVPSEDPIMVLAATATSDIHMGGNDTSSTFSSARPCPLPLNFPMSRHEVTGPKAGKTWIEIHRIKTVRPRPREGKRTQQQLEAMTTLRYQAPWRCQWFRSLYDLLTVFPVLPFLSNIDELRHFP